MNSEVRLRIRFSKLGKIRFIGHRDLARVWERAIHQAGVPIAFSQGFTPHPKISFGLALPVGWESVAEYLDLTLVSEMPDLVPALNVALPQGARIEEVTELAMKPKSLSSQVSRADYSVWVAPSAGDPSESGFIRALGDGLEGVMGADQVPVKRNKKGEEIEEDIRPLVFELGLAGSGHDDHSYYGTKIHMTLATQPRVLRPEEVATALTLGGLACEVSLVRRESQHVVVDGMTVDPMHRSALGHAGAA